MAPLTTSIRRQITVAARFSRYVAIGDSFTEGLMDFAADSEHTDPGDGFRGWADRLAEQLVTSPAGSPDLAYANLAIRGRLADQVLTEQLPRALELAPDLVSIVAGGNDCLRPYTDIDALAGEIESAVVRLREAGVEVLMATGYDTETASPLLRAVRSRVAIFNSHLWTIAQRHGCHMLDLWGLRDLYSSENVGRRPHPPERTGARARVTAGTRDARGHGGHAPRLRDAGAAGASRAAGGGRGDDVGADPPRPLGIAPAASACPAATGWNRSCPPSRACAARTGRIRGGTDPGGTGLGGVGWGRACRGRSGVGGTGVGRAGRQAAPRRSCSGPDTK